MAKKIKVEKKDNYFQHIVVIKENRNKRHKHQKFFVEGVKNINKALEHDWEIEAFIYSFEKKLSDWAKNVLANTKADHHYQFTSELLKELSDKEETSELLAIVKYKKFALADIPLKNDLLVAIFDRPANPGNLGAIIRSCESFKVDALILTGHSVDTYDTATIKPSVGTFFCMPIVHLPSPEELKPLFKRYEDAKIDYQIVGTSAKNNIYPDQHSFKRATFLVIGNETTGMSNYYKDLCTHTVKIPMYGNASSFNVACATSIVLYEIDRQRR